LNCETAISQLATDEVTNYLKPECWLLTGLGMAYLLAWRKEQTQFPKTSTVWHGKCLQSSLKRCQWEFVQCGWMYSFCKWTALSSENVDDI